MVMVTVEVEMVLKTEIKMEKMLKLMEMEMVTLTKETPMVILMEVKTLDPQMVMPMVT